MMLDFSNAWAIAQRWLDEKVGVGVQVDKLHMAPSRPGEILALYTTPFGNLCGLIVGVDDEGVERVVARQDPMPEEGNHFELFAGGETSW